ncbi:hypothetical protein M011DRAFT_455921 [Sporormia fimetaria CBS 119925]|uniref:Zinc finger PHD-type domain-containing protein n=1 Tax=Sporormia fimetaria CBS 119925 TaxID=1340428 RepID=A0A6A6VK15_9PLEO|nr:hypothetical protein M011DRAFT_455921 [Sporormia fimetaria CBS 119925]
MVAAPMVVVRRRMVSRYGYTVVRIHVGTNLKDVYDIHEELLCANSSYFRKQLQGNRQAVEEICYICSDEMTPGQASFGFCRSCGGNYHRHCLKKYDKRDPLDETFSCFQCGALWRASEDSKHDGIQHLQCPKFGKEAFQFYFEWLYESKISIGLSDDEQEVCGTEEEQSLGNLYHQLIKAHTLAMTIDDNKFGAAILLSIVQAAEEYKIYPGIFNITKTYKRTEKGSKLRNVLVDFYVGAKNSAEWLDIDGYPMDFLRDLAQATLKARGINMNEIRENLNDIYGSALAKEELGA